MAKQPPKSMKRCRKRGGSTKSAPPAMRGRQKKMGRPKKITTRVENAVMNLLEKLQDEAAGQRTVTAKELFTRYKGKLSFSSMRRILQSKAKFRKPLEVPPLTTKDRKDRVKWCKKVLAAMKKSSLGKLAWFDVHAVPKVRAI
jgi:hypothetical protein